MEKRLELKVETGTLAGRVFAVRPGGLRLGRSSSNDVHVPDESLSRNHCLFECEGETGIRVSDLASANGTFVNGRQLGNAALTLKAGDVIEVGETRIRVVGDRPPEAVPTAVDLGLGPKRPAGGEPVAVGTRRRSWANLLWVFAFLLMVAAICLVMSSPAPQPTAAPQPVVQQTPVVQEVVYEKIEADSDSVFRYALTYTPAGVMAVSLYDNGLRPTQPKRLSKEAIAELNQILAFDALKDLSEEYAGAESDPPVLRSWSLKVVYSTRLKTVSIVNTLEPDAFKTVREKLEAFTKNELGIWAISYSREKLIELGESSLDVARIKWDDRDTSQGNLFAAISAYRETLYYLETVSPKPDFALEAKTGLEKATAELDKRYSDQRFEAERLIRLQQWDAAKRELRVLMDMVPDRGDDRYREASAKLMDVEKRVKNGGSAK